LNQESHDFAGSSANHHESSVPEIAFNRQILGVAYSPMDLQGLVRYLEGRLSGKQLRYGTLESSQFSIIQQASGLENEEA
jgi:hypothetical protein